MFVGHQKQFQYLKRLVELDRLPHAFLFFGPEKTGKKALAVEFVSWVFKYDVFRKEHPDFIFIEPQQKEIQIAQVRDCLWRLSLKPSLAPLKAAIIDQAHALNQEAQSALLKTLEEPKGRTLLILVTEYPEALFPTILSRVQKIKFQQKNQLPRPEEKTMSEIGKIARADLASRFQYAEKVSKEPELRRVLIVWLYYFRQKMISELKSGAGTAVITAKTAQRIQDIIFLITKTNINPRLALENLMLAL